MHNPPAVVCTGWCSVQQAPCIVPCIHNAVSAVGAHAGTAHGSLLSPIEERPDDLHDVTAAAVFPRSRLAATLRDHRQDDRIAAFISFLGEAESRQTRRIGDAATI